MEWKILRSFVSQTDDKSCGVLTCLFIDCMRKGFNVSGVKKNIDSTQLSKYRWWIGRTLMLFKNEDYVENEKRGPVEVIDLFY